MNPPAGFWRRYAAYSVDCTALLLLASPLLWPRLRALVASFQTQMTQLQDRMWLLMEQAIDGGGDPLAQLGSAATDPALQAGIATLSGTLLRAGLGMAVILFLLGAAWFIAFEASAWQATPGKRLAGLRVTTLEGGRCGPARIALRFLGGVPSWLLFNLGHAMVGWTPGRRALHDYIAATRVELAPGAGPAMPRWARSWLLLQAAGFFGLLGFVGLRYVQLLVESTGAGSG